MNASELAQALLDLEGVRSLVRDGLGCHCPDEVFDDVVVGCPSVFSEEDARSTLQLLVGRRLLVSLVDVHRLDDLRSGAEQLLLRGHQVRETQGLSRFRLVLIGHCDSTVVEALKASAARIDDRMHVHVLTADALAALVGG